MPTQTTMPEETLSSSSKKSKSSDVIENVFETNSKDQKRQPIHSCLPGWTYVGPDPRKKPMFDPLQCPADIQSIDLGGYVRANVTNVDNADDPKGREFFDMGLRLMLSYQHELAARCFLACLEVSKNCALAHGFVALCHSPNYNFKGEAYYESAHHPEEADKNDLLCVFPSQQVADRHSKMGLELVEAIRKLNRRGSVGSSTGGSSGSAKGGKKGRSKNNKKFKGSSKTITNTGNGQNVVAEEETSGSTDAGDIPPNLISDVESQLLSAIRILACHPGLEHTLSDDIVGRSSEATIVKRLSFKLVLFCRYPSSPILTRILLLYRTHLMVLTHVTDLCKGDHMQTR